MTDETPLRKKEIHPTVIVRTDHVRNNKWRSILFRSIRQSYRDGQLEKSPNDAVSILKKAEDLKKRVESVRDAFVEHEGADTTDILLELCEEVLAVTASVIEVLSPQLDSRRNCRDAPDQRNALRKILTVTLHSLNSDWTFEEYQSVLKRSDLSDNTNLEYSPKIQRNVQTV
jgi:hypothetical protein